MTAAVVVLGVCVIAALIALVVLERAHAVERRRLVDRIIARHVGEVIALDHEAEPKAPTIEPAKKPYLEGVS